MFEQVAQQLSPAELSLVQPRLFYRGATLPFSEMALLFQMADAYLAPYHGEGFVTPALEAIACGCPVICTAGGPTDDFTTSDFALRIESRVEPIGAEDGTAGQMLLPDIHSLYKHMLTVIEQPDIAARARLAGPQFVNEKFTWKLVVDRLLQVLFPE